MWITLGHASEPRTAPCRCAAARHGWWRRRCQTWSRAPRATALVNMRRRSARTRSTRRSCRTGGQPQKMLLDAIALLRADGSTKAPPAEASSTNPKPAQDTAERRQVTVLFSDLVGSTALAGRMDPQDLREINSAYQKCVADTVLRFGGFAKGRRIRICDCQPTVGEADGQGSAWADDPRRWTRRGKRRSAADPRGTTLTN